MHQANYCTFFYCTSRHSQTDSVDRLSVLCGISGLLRVIGECVRTQHIIHCAVIGEALVTGVMKM